MLHGSGNVGLRIDEADHGPVGYENPLAMRSTGEMPVRVLVRNKKADR